MRNTVGKLAVGCLWEVRSSQVWMLTISKLRGRGRCLLPRTG